MSVAARRNDLKRVTKSLAFTARTGATHWEELSVDDKRALIEAASLVKAVVLTIRFPGGKTRTISVDDLRREVEKEETVLYPRPNTNLWLDPIPPSLRQHAVDALEKKNVEGFFFTAENTSSLDLLVRNFLELKMRGLYEEALLRAWAATRTNNSSWPHRTLRMMFERADRKRLLAAGDPLPGPGPFTLYRGVAGRGAARRIRGLSWTALREMAIWFATRYDHLAAPSICTVTIAADDVLAYVDDRSEEDFILSLRPETKIKVEAIDAVSAKKAREWHDQLNALQLKELVAEGKKRRKRRVRASSRS